MNAEQSRVESTQRALEEQRKVMVQQIAMEREELEKAKVSAATCDPCRKPKAAHCVTSPPCPRVPCWRSRSLSCTSVGKSGGALQPSGPNSMHSKS